MARQQQGIRPQELDYGPQESYRAPMRVPVAQIAMPKGEVNMNPIQGFGPSQSAPNLAAVRNFIDMSGWGRV
jgi:hypothetical protein